MLELENATLRALIGSFFSTRLLYSIVQKGTKQIQNRPMENLIDKKAILIGFRKVMLLASQKLLNFSNDLQHQKI